MKVDEILALAKEYEVLSRTVDELKLMNGFGDPVDCICIDNTLGGKAATHKKHISSHRGQLIFKWLEEGMINIIVRMQERMLEITTLLERTDDA